MQTSPEQPLRDSLIFTGVTNPGLWLLCPQTPGLIPPRQQEAAVIQPDLGSGNGHVLGTHPHVHCWENLGIFPNPSHIALTAPTNSERNRTHNSRVHNSRREGDLPTWKFLSEMLLLPPEQQRSCEQVRSLPLALSGMHSKRRAPKLSHCKSQLKPSP